VGSTSSPSRCPATSRAGRTPPAATSTWLDRAEALGWPTARLRAGHFHALVDPDGLAAAMLALLARI